MAAERCECELITQSVTVWDEGDALTLQNDYRCGDASNSAQGAQSQNDAKPKHDPLEFGSGELSRRLETSHGRLGHTGDLSHSTITRKNAIKLGVNDEKML